MQCSVARLQGAQVSDPPRAKMYLHRSKSNQQQSIQSYGRNLCESATTLGRVHRELVDGWLGHIWSRDGEEFMSGGGVTNGEHRRWWAARMRCTLLAVEAQGLWTALPLDRLDSSLKQILADIAWQPCKRQHLRTMVNGDGWWFDRKYCIA